MAFDWTNLIPVGLQAAGSFLQYNDKKNREADLQRQYQAYVAAKQFQEQQALANRSSGGGRGGGNKRAAAKMMEEYIKRAQARYEPIAKAAMDILPQQTALYQSAMPGAQNFVNTALSPEVIKDAMTFNRPEMAALPEYLYGGNK